MIVDRTRIILLSLILLVGCIVVTAACIWTLYRAVLAEQKSRLVVTAQSQARLIEAMARFDAEYSNDYPGGPTAATMRQIIDAHAHFRGFGETGEFTVARREGDLIVFQFRHRHDHVEIPRPIPFASQLAEPMRRALNGHSGTVVGLDYRGETVLAAHEPIAELDMGIVAKIDMAEVRAPFVRAATIASLIAAIAVVIGVYLVIRVGSPIIRRLERQAQALETEVEERKQIEVNLQGANKRMRQNLQTAALVQKSLLPTDGVGIEGLNVSYCVKPCEELGGDVLDVFRLDDRYVGLYVLDVSGHGVSAALQSVMLNRFMCPLPEQSSLLRQHVAGTSEYRIVPPADVAAQLNRQFPMDLERQHYFTLVYGILDRKTGEFRYVSAGHPGPAHLPRHAPPSLVESPGFPIGVYKEADYFEQSIILKPGDRLFLYSDGVTEAVNAAEERFGHQRLIETLRRTHGMSLQDSTSCLLENVSTWRQGEKPLDDVSLLAVEVEKLAPGMEPPDRCQTPAALEGRRLDS